MPKKKRSKKEESVIQIDLSFLFTKDLLTPVAILTSGLLVSLAIFFGTTELRKPVPINFDCSSDSPLSGDCLLNYAQNIGLDLNSFAGCIDNDETSDVITEELDAAEELQLSGTPAIFVGKGRGDNFRGFNVGVFTGFEEFQELLDYLAENSIENTQSFWVNKLLDRLNDFEEQVREFYKSSQGGGLKGKELERTVSEFISTEQQNLEALSELRSLSAGNGNIMGDGEIVVMEFSDYECPFCNDYANDMGKKFIDKYVNTGIARFIFRDFPMESTHPNAREAAEAARCAEKQGKYFEYHDQLFGVNNEGE